jgi:hypothetical protein
MLVGFHKHVNYLRQTVSLTTLMLKFVILRRLALNATLTGFRNLSGGIRQFVDEECHTYMVVELLTN